MPYDLTHVIAHLSFSGQDAMAGVVERARNELTRLRKEAQDRDEALEWMASSEGGCLDRQGRGYRVANLEGGWDGEGPTPLAAIQNAKREPTP